MEHQCVHITRIFRWTVMLVVILISQGAVDGRPRTTYEKVNAVEGTNVYLECRMNETYPQWQGPPSLSIYNLHSSFFQDVPSVKAGQLQWHSDNKSLIILFVNKSNGGIYKCTSSNQVEFYLELVGEAAVKTSHCAQGSMKHESNEFSSKHKVNVSTLAGYVALGLSVSPMVIISWALLGHCVYTRRQETKAMSAQVQRETSEKYQADKPVVQEYH